MAQGTRSGAQSRRTRASLLWVHPGRWDETSDRRKVSSRFNVSMRTAHDDYKRAMELLRTEQTGTREELLNQLQALRLATVQKALKRGHFQTVATLLGDMGRVIGEAAPEQLALQVPELSIQIEDKKN